MLKHLIIASLAAASLAATSAQAQDVRTAKVSIAGIDMHSERGAQVVFDRIKFAAGAVCGDIPTRLERHRRYDPCVLEVTQRTVTGLNNPLLTAMLAQDQAAASGTLVASAK